MPTASHVGSPTGEGNPPGKHTEGYLKNPYGSESGKDGHFVRSKSYMGDMHVGGNSENSPEAPTKPKTERTIGLTSMYEGGIDKTI